MPVSGIAAIASPAASQELAGHMTVRRALPTNAYSLSPTNGSCIADSGLYTVRTGP